MAEPRIFGPGLTGRYYISSAYRQEAAREVDGKQYAIFCITGKKYDVTDQVLALQEEARALPPLKTDTGPFFSPHDPEGWDTDTGMPGIGLFSNAVQVWALSQDTSVTVADAARAFNCSPLMIIEAVEFHYWMFLNGPRDDFNKLAIEHEGE